MKKLMSMILAVLTVLTALPLAFIAVPEDVAALAVSGQTEPTLDSDMTVYVDDGGNDSNDGATPDTPFLTLNKAFDTLGDGGIIKIVTSLTLENEMVDALLNGDTYDADGDGTLSNLNGDDAVGDDGRFFETRHNSLILITSADESNPAKIVFGVWQDVSTGSMKASEKGMHYVLNGPTTFENIKFSATKAPVIYGNFYPLTIGEGVSSVSEADGTDLDFLVVGGVNVSSIVAYRDAGNNYIARQLTGADFISGWNNRDSHIIIKSGNISELAGLSRGMPHSYTSDSYIDITGDASIDFFAGTAKGAAGNYGGSHIYISGNPTIGKFAGAAYNTAGSGYSYGLVSIKITGDPTIETLAGITYAESGGNHYAGADIDIEGAPSVAYFSGGSVNGTADNGGSVYGDIDINVSGAMEMTAARFCGAVFKSTGGVYGDVHIDISGAVDFKKASAALTGFAVGASTSARAECKNNYGNSYINLTGSGQYSFINGIGMDIADDSIAGSSNITIDLDASAVRLNNRICGGGYRYAGIWGFSYIDFKNGKTAATAGGSIWGGQANGTSYAANIFKGSYIDISGGYVHVVYGGNNASSAEHYSNATASVNISGGSIGNAIYMGSYTANARLTKRATLTWTGGTIVSGTTAIKPAFTSGDYFIYYGGSITKDMITARCTGNSAATTNYGSFAKLGTIEGEGTRVHIRPLNTTGTVYLSGTDSEGNVRSIRDLDDSSAISPTSVLDGSTPALAVCDIYDAMCLLGDNGGTVVLCGSYTLGTEKNWTSATSAVKTYVTNDTSYMFCEPRHSGKITVTSKYGDDDYSDALFMLGNGDIHSYNLSGMTEFNDIKFGASTAAGKVFAFCARFYDLTLGSGIVNDADNDGTIIIISGYIVAGSGLHNTNVGDNSTGSRYGKNSIVVRSGNFSAIYGGLRVANAGFIPATDLKGYFEIFVGEDATVDNIYLGSTATNATQKVPGTELIKCETRGNVSLIYLGGQYEDVCDIDEAYIAINATMGGNASLNMSFNNVESMTVQYIGSVLDVGTLADDCETPGCEYYPIYDEAALLDTSGFAIRTSGVQGMRYTAKIDESARAKTIADDGYIVREYGLMVKKATNASDFKYFATGKVNANRIAKTVSYRNDDVDPVDIYRKLENQKYYFSCVLVNIPENRYGDNYTFCSYMLIETADGTLVPIFGYEQELSIRDAATVIKDSTQYDGMTVDEQAYIDSIIG